MIPDYFKRNGLYIGKRYLGFVKKTPTGYEGLVYRIRHGYAVQIIRGPKLKSVISHVRLLTDSGINRLT